MKHRWTNVITDDRGQDMVEYGLIMGLVSLIAVAALLATGETIQSYWETLSTSIPVL
jgi:Flp pilus assembly pilin Flp